MLTYHKAKKQVSPLLRLPLSLGPAPKQALPLALLQKFLNQKPFLKALLLLKIKACLLPKRLVVFLFQVPKQIMKHRLLFMRPL
jgi:hypothetical protein